MGISANKITQDNPVALQRFVVDTAPATSQTNVTFARVKPGFRGEIVAVRANARTVNSYSVPGVLIGAQNVLASAITPTALNVAVAEGTLVADRSLRRFGPTDEILINLTTGATAPVNPRVEVVVRPFPLNGEA